MLGRVQDAVAIVTGGASGIGRAVVRRFVAEGAFVVAADISDSLETTVGDLPEKRVLAIQVDVVREADIIAMVALAVDRFGRVDLLCQSAGIAQAPALLDQETEEALDHILRINLHGVFLGMKHALPVMARQGSGSVINIASVAGLAALPGLSGYAASKAGVMALTRAAAVEYGPMGVRVNAICPGRIDTPMMHGRTKDPARQAASVQHSPTRRHGTADEVAGAALFLASDDAGYVNGVALPVDGGWTAASAGWEDVRVGSPE
jgi:NAD(P)-dependent dehydrogenase (short-subunit alcohol dehydrogenase family)